MAGVIPVIFAAALLAFPATIAQYFPGTQQFVNDHFQPGNLTYLLTEAAMIILFTYFYTAVQFNPVEQADNLRQATAATSRASGRARRPRSTSTACSHA